MMKEYLLNEFIRDESGQGINEYAFIMAFVSLVIIMVFGFSQGKLSSAISQSFQSAADEMQRLSAGPST